MKKATCTLLLALMTTGCSSYFEDIHTEPTGGWKVEEGVDMKADMEMPDDMFVPDMAEDMGVDMFVPDMFVPDMPKDEDMFVPDMFTPDMSMGPRLRGFALGNHSCVIRGDDKVWCWGDNVWTQLGDGTQVDKEIPQPVPGLMGATEIDGGFFHSCAIVAEGQVDCWGDNSLGQLGDGTTQERGSLVRVLRLRGAQELTVGNGHSCIRLINKKVECWGDNQAGQLGSGMADDKTVGPLSVKGLADVTHISAGRYHTCASLSDGTVKCWGANANGQLGNTSKMNSPTPLEVPGLTDVIDLESGGDHSCALISNGQIKCWGSNWSGQLGDGTKVDNASPVRVQGITNAVQLAVGGEAHSCARLETGKVMCWGYNDAGELGHAKVETESTVPVEVVDLEDVEDVEAGFSHTCARTTNKDVYCWGYNADGQLGAPSVTPSKPVKVDFP